MILLHLLSMPLTSSYGRLFNDGGELFVVLMVVLGVFVVVGNGDFSKSTLFGILSYMRLPSGAFGGLGNDTLSGFGIFSFGVKISHSPTTGPGLPKRSAISVTLPRSFFLYNNKWPISSMDLPDIFNATVNQITLIVDGCIYFRWLLLFLYYILV